MADENKQVDKEALKAQKQAEKEALKAKKERIKQSKPKKSDQGNIFVRMGKAIKKFFKDFKGTCKKVIWPDRKTVLKNTLIVFITVIIVGIGIWIVDFGLSRGIRFVQDTVKEAASVRALEDDVADEGSSDPVNAVTTTNAADALEPSTEGASD